MHIFFGIITVLVAKGGAADCIGETSVAHGFFIVASPISIVQAPAAACSLVGHRSSSSLSLSLSLRPLFVDKFHLPSDTSPGPAVYSAPVSQFGYCLDGVLYEWFQFRVSHGRWSPDLFFHFPNLLNFVVFLCSLSSDGVRNVWEIREYERRNFHSRETFTFFFLVSQSQVLH